MTDHRVPFAGIATCAVALAIDAAIVEGSLLVTAALLSLVGQLVGGVHLAPVAKLLAASAWAVGTAAYFVVFWSAGGQTPGMRAMRLRVATADGRPPGTSRSIVRVLWLGLCILPAFTGFLPVLFDECRRGVHDLVARTVVLYD